MNYLRKCPSARRISKTHHPLSTAPRSIMTAGKHTADEISSTTIGTDYFSPLQFFGRRLMNSFVTDGWKYPLFLSDRVRERKSVFLAHASTLSSTSELSHFIDRLNALPALKRATHCMYAYRVIPDPVNPSSKIVGQHDGGERGSGEHLSRLLDALECKNVVVVVSRWYGGVPLGSDRWKLISSVAKEALKNGNFIEQKTDDGSTGKRHNDKKKKK